MKTKSVIKKSAMIPTALIAGGAGFVGSFLCEALLTKGARVIVLDNFKTGRQSYVNHLLSNPNFALYDCDINVSLPEEIQSVDYIFHLAGLEEYSYSKEVIDLSSLLTNAFGTKNLLDLAKVSEAKFLLLSTLDVYEGRMSQIEISEYFGRNKIEENRYMVAEAKRYAEALVWQYYKKHELDVRIVRVPEIYGPNMNLISSGILGKFISDVIAGRDLTIYGEGNEREFYLFIDDAIAGVLKAMYNDKTRGNIFALVPNEPVTVLEMAYMIKGVADSGIQVKFEDASTDGYFKRGILKLPDTFNLQLLKWEPKVSLKEGIMRSLESLNYSPNTHSFKPAKLIDLKSKTVPSIQPQELFSLSEVKEPANNFPKNQISSQQVSSYVKTPAALIQADHRGANFAEKPKWSLPKVNLSINFPKIKLPSLPKLYSNNMPHYSAEMLKPKSKLAFRVMMLVAFLIPAFVIFVGLPSISLFLNSKRAFDSLNKAKSDLEVLNTAGVKDNARNAYDSFYKAKNAISSLRPVFIVLQKQDQYRSLDNLISSLTNFSKAIYTGAKATAPLDNLWEVIRPDTFEHINPQQFADSKTHLENARNSLILAQADNKYVNKLDLPKKLQGYYDEYGSALNTAVDGIDIGLPVIASLPDLLGSVKPRKYLILFQNSTEIRATGGFIGSYGLLTLEEGKIKDLLIDDIYNPDGQIDQRSIVADIPEPIKTFLKEERLHIRNANWNPDFTKSANTISDLYFKVTGEKVDGVFAIDLYFIQDLLRATGPIYLSAYNEEITAENVYERAEFHSEFNYQNGSDQKRSFLTVLGSKLLERLFSLERSKIAVLGKSVVSSLEQRHLLLSFTNDPINNLIKNKSWDGALVSTPKDYLFVVDSNLGGTKANFYVKKSMQYEVSSLTRDGVLRGVLQLEYKHTGKDLAWPGGPYTDYLRVLTQNGARLTAATLKENDKPIQDIFAAVVTGTEGLYSTFETSFVLQPQSTIVVTLSYDLSPITFLNKETKEYSLLWQKQSGTQDEQATFRFAKPFGFNFVGVSSNAEISGDVVTLDRKLNKDEFVYVKL